MREVLGDRAGFVPESLQPSAYLPGQLLPDKQPLIQTYLVQTAN